MDGRWVCFNLSGRSTYHGKHRLEARRTIRLVLIFDEKGLVRIVREQQNIDKFGFRIVTDVGKTDIY